MMKYIVLAVAVAQTSAYVQYTSSACRDPNGSYISGYQSGAMNHQDCRANCDLYSWCMGVRLQNSASQCRLLTESNNHGSIPGFPYFYNLGSWTATPQEWVESSASSYTCEWKGASANGDPHFNGFDGSKYDFQGQPSEWFNIISDSDFQMNAFFVESPTDGKTYMGKLGFMMGPNKISISSTKVSITTPTLKIDLIEGTQQLTDANGEAAGFVHVSNEAVTLHSKGFQCEIMTIENMGFTYLNVDTSASSEGLSSPHGLLGQTAQFMVKGEEPKPVELSHQNKNAAGFIEGHSADYLVSDGEFGTSFSFNQFGSAAKANGYPQRFAHGKASYLA